MKNPFKYTFTALFIFFLMDFNAQEQDKLSVEFSAGNQQFSMKHFNRYYIDSIGKKNRGFEEGIHSGAIFSIGFRYKPNRFFDVGISGNYQAGKTVGRPKFYDYPNGQQVVYIGEFTYKSEALVVGISSALFLDGILHFQEKKSKLIQRTHLSLDVFAGIGFSKMNSEIRYPEDSPNQGQYVAYTSNQDFQGQLALKIEYDFLKKPLISSIGVKGGFQHFATKTLKNRLGKEWVVVGDHPINLDFSGFFGAIYVTIGN